MNKKEIHKLLETKDDDLLFRFPGYSRGELRKLKRKETLKEETELKAPKILIWDIETAPLLTVCWGLFEQNIQPAQVINDGFVLSWAAKWLREPKIIHDRITGKEARHQNDKRILTVLWKLLDAADIVVGHNIDRFDIKKVNAKFIEYDMKLPSPYLTVDTLKQVKKISTFTSHKLDYLLQRFKMPHKIDTGGLELWKKCRLGDEHALEVMDRYCRNDVLITEQLYSYLRPYIQHPNMGLYLEQEVCPNCGSQKITWSGTVMTQSQVYEQGRCECGKNVRRAKGLRKNKLLK